MLRVYIATVSKTLKKGNDPTGFRVQEEELSQRATLTDVYTKHIPSR